MTVALDQLRAAARRVRFRGVGRDRRRICPRPAGASAEDSNATRRDASAPREQAASAPGLDRDRVRGGRLHVELEVVVRGEGWSAEGETPWLHASGVWLRAADLLPDLGHDPDRLVRAPRERRAHGLGPVPTDVAARALAPAAGVAPAGDWRWTVTFAAADRGPHRPGGAGSAPPARPARFATTGRTDGPLDFAAAWWPGAPVETRRGAVSALHGPQRARDADGVLDDVLAMRACVAATLGRAPAVRTVLQAPRERGETAPTATCCGCPSTRDGTWPARASAAGNAAPPSPPRWPPAPWPTGPICERSPARTGCGSASPAGSASSASGTRTGWTRGWPCRARASDQVVAALGALDAPAIGVAAAGDAPWVQEYTPLATVGWVESVGPAAAGDAVAAVAAAVRAGAPARRCPRGGGRGGHGRGAARTAGVVRCPDRAAEPASR